MGSDSGDVVAHILNSKYRTHVLESLVKRGQATPKQLATRTGDPRPHVSRALSELREHGVVELQVSEGRNVGRYYGVTERGRSVWSEVRATLRDVEWVHAEPTTPEAKAIVDLARAEFGSGLRLVCLSDGSSLTVLYAETDVFASYSDEEFEQAVRTLRFDHGLDDLHVGDQACWSEVTHFEDFSLTRIRVADDTTVTISFDRGEDVQTPAFAERVVEAFTEPSA